ncbi:BTB/POZ domain-containing protein 7-like [Clavelina lepadiformis]|uniref:BTB/POZ domain-containing protein 7-like n=1 Tax=Clavelina lepadiformis TaxID=159417 RepID=UPI00404292B2
MIWNCVDCRSRLLYTREMTGPHKKKLAQRERKTRLAFSSLKKKLNLPKIYKRIASKLSVHGRNIRALTSAWSTDEIQCLVAQYELTTKLKELSDAADLARNSTSNVAQDLVRLQEESYLCDLCLKCNRLGQDEVIEEKRAYVHSALFCKRTQLLLPQANCSYKRNFSESLSTNSAADEVDFSLLPSILLAPFTSLGVKLKYFKSTQTLEFESKENLPENFISELISFIYGEQLHSDKMSMAGTSIGVSEGTAPMNSPMRRPTITSEPESPHSMLKQRKLDVLAHMPPEDMKTAGKEAKKDFFFKTSEKFSDDFLNIMKDLLLSANTTGDVKLVFTVSSLLSVLSSHMRSRQPGLCCHGHSFVLAARSSFFKNIIGKHKERYSRDENSSSFMTIELDSKVVPPRYFPVVLHAMYTGELDLQRIKKATPLILQRIDSEALSTDVKDLIELLYIGHFLDFPSLAQGCENALYDKVNVSNLVELLQWSSQPHGSTWLHRQIVRYARDNFQQLMVSGTLLSLTSSELTEIIQSDFVNAPELDILRTVLKWGEHELLRRIELREPNLVRSHVLLNQHRSFRAASASRRELLLASNKDELHDSTASLLSRVRIRHILPPNHEVLTNAIRRGVISRPPEHLLEWHHHSGAVTESNNAFFWLRIRAGMGFSPPRLFAPHVAETKAILEERLCQETESNSSSKAAKQSCPQRATPGPSVSSAVVPDALYMVKETQHSHKPASLHSVSCDKCRVSRISVASLATKRLKYIDDYYPAPSPSLASKLLTRERHLRRSPWIKETLQACHSSSVSVPHCCCRSERLSDADGSLGSGTLCNLCRAEHYIRLLVVREFGLSDILTDLLRKPHLYYDPDELVTYPFISSHIQNHRPLVRTPSNCQSSSVSAPRRFQKFFHKKVAASHQPKDSTASSCGRSWKDNSDIRGSSSDVSSSEDSSSSTEWPFPYTGVDMNLRTQPGSAFWDSDSSLTKTPPISTVPDVAASADSTLKSYRSRVSSSTSDSSVSVTCRFVAQSHPGEPDETSLRSSPVLEQRPSTSRRGVPSYAHYLSVKRPQRMERTISALTLPRTFFKQTREINREQNNRTQTSSPLSVQHPAGNPVPELLLDGKSADKPAADVPPDLCAGSVFFPRMRSDPPKNATLREGDTPSIDDERVTPSSNIDVNFLKDTLLIDKETCI